MIDSKEKLKYYLLCDEYARFGQKVSYIKKKKTGALWNWNVRLRKLEYYQNKRKAIYFFPLLYNRIAFRRLSYKTGWFVAPNSFKEGLCIVHPGTVIINAKTKGGKFCRIHAGVNIGTNSGENKAPILGDYVYIAPGAKVFGNITIASDIAIGANAVVRTSFLESKVTLGGIPAQVISNKGSVMMIKKYNIKENENDKK